MIGSSVNPALGRIDYSPITQGAQSAAQSIQAGGQAYGQMFSNLGNVGAQIFGSLAKQKKEEEQYKSIISSTKAFVKNVDSLKDISPEVKDWVKKTTQTIDDPKLSSMEKANIAQALNPMLNSVIGGAMSQSMADEARRKQSERVVTALRQNQNAGITEQLNTPGMTFEKLNVAAKASPQQTLSLLVQQGVPVSEAISIIKNTDELDRKMTEAQIGLIEAQTEAQKAPKVTAVTDKAATLNRAVAAEEQRRGVKLNAIEIADVEKSLETPTLLLRPGTKKDLILEDPETGNKKTVPSYWDGNEWRDDVSGAPVYLSPPGMFGGGGKTPNPLIFGRSSAPDVGAGVRDFGDLLNPKPKK
jgi:hemoglobin-like flavoprotein